MPSDVADLHESFTADQLLDTVRDLVAGAPGPRLVPDLTVSAASR